jgi:hypothetical protein
MKRKKKKSRDFIHLEHIKRQGAGTGAHKSKRDYKRKKRWVEDDV